MDLTTYSWWLFPTIKTPRTLSETHFLMGIECVSFEGSMGEYFMTLDGKGLFVFKSSPIYKGETSQEFKDLTQWLHKEEWLWAVEDEMERIMRQHCDDNDLDPYDDGVTFREIDEACEWLPKVVPELYAKQLPTEDKLRELSFAYYFNQTLPTIL